jgi:hypothetical protein
MTDDRCSDYLDRLTAGAAGSDEAVLSMTVDGVLVSASVREGSLFMSVFGWVTPEQQRSFLEALVPRLLPTYKELREFLLDDVELPADPGIAHELR